MGQRLTPPSTFAKPSITHYVPYFTEQSRSRALLTVCDRFVEIAEHSPEPSCPFCRAWLHLETEPLETR